MAKIIVITVFLCCLTAVLARDETSSCRDVTRQTCAGFQQCCARKCAGAHDTSCQESNGRISLANCECRGGSTGSHGSHGGSTHGEIDHSAICRSQASGSCIYFKNCCNNKCARPARLACSSVGASLTEAVCRCPSSATGSGFMHTTPYYSSHGGSSGGHGNTGLRETGDQDFTQTCARNYNDCASFRTCCTNRCAGRNVQAQCQERMGSLKNTLCKCTGHGN